MLASGFTSAPITRFLVVGVVVCSMLASITDTKYYFWIAVKPHLRDYRQLWRLLTWQLCYTNSTEVLFAAMTLYQLRVIERLWGSRKFVFPTVDTTVYHITSPILLAAIIRPLSLNNINYLPAGPTPIVFALLAQYHAAIPYLYKYRLSASSTPDPDIATSGVILTSKATSYLLPLQLALSQLPGSAVAAGIGWLVGYGYRMEILPGAASWRIPDWSGKRRERERYEGLRRRMEGEAASASGVEGAQREGQDVGRRRTVGGQILDQFRGAF
ncbi:hypothetical protein H2203_008864 [Taxawa tesnikishii (nom. ined.)]|nr:hypothetical protein H2203_008864 [Dothideales sp. JES 119]